MSKPKSKQHELAVAAFKRLGVKEPSVWAKHECGSDSAALVRAAFIKAVWREIPADDSDAWLTTMEEELRPRAERLLAGRGSKADLGAIVRQAKVNTLLSIVGVLDAGNADFVDLGRPVEWGMYEVLADEKPGRPLGSLHETLYSFDPTGRYLDPPSDKAGRAKTAKRGGTRKATSKKR